MNSWISIKPFRYWVQKILPLVYDDTLSYYELLNKVVCTLNDVIENTNNVPTLVKDMISEYISSGEIGTVVSEIISSYMLNVKFPPNNLTPASGDGSTDDTEAIQGCIDYAIANNMAVYFPCGNYLTGSLTANGNVGIYGSDRYKTKLVLKSGSSNPVITSVGKITISGITVDGNAGVQVSNNSVIDITADSAIIYNAIIDNGYNLLDVKIGSDLQITDVIFGHAIHNAFIFNSVNGGTVQGNNLYFNYLSELSGDGYVVINGDKNILEQMKFITASNKCITVNGNNNIVKFWNNGSTNPLVTNGENNEYEIYTEGSTLNDKIDNVINVVIPGLTQEFETFKDDVNGELNDMREYIGNAINLVWINVKDYGAVGDGVTDDTEAIQRALDDAFARHVILYFPNGNYKVTNELYENGKSGAGVYFAPDAWLKFLDQGTSIPSDCTSVLEFAGCQNVFMHNVSIDCGEQLGINGFGTNGLNNTTEGKTKNIYIDTFRVKNAKVSPTTLGGHGITFQYNCENIHANQIIAENCYIGCDVTGSFTYSEVMSESTGITIDSINCFNCEIAFSSYSIQTPVNDTSAFNYVYIDSIYAYQCGVSQLAQEPNNHLNNGAEGDGTDGGVVAFIGCPRGIYINNIYVNNRSTSKIGGVIRGRVKFSRFNHVELVNGNAIALFNNDPIKNTLPIDANSGASFYGITEYVNMAFDVKTIVDYIIKSTGDTSSASPHRINHVNVDVNYIRTPAIGNATSEAIPLANFVNINVSNSQAIAKGNAYYMYDNLSLENNAEKSYGVNKKMMNTRIESIGNNYAPIVHLERQGTRPAVFHMNVDGKANVSDGTTNYCAFDGTNLVFETVGSYNVGCLKVGSIYLWANAGHLYWKNGKPNNATDGTQIG